MLPRLYPATVGRVNVIYFHENATVKTS